MISLDFDGIQNIPDLSDDFIFRQRHFNEVTFSVRSQLSWTFPNMLGELFAGIGNQLSGGGL